MAFFGMEDDGYDPPAPEAAIRLRKLKPVCDELRTAMANEIDCMCRDVLMEQDNNAH